MAMGIVSDEDFNSELSRVSNNTEKLESARPVITGEVIDVSRGRGEGSTSVPDGLRKLIGEESVTNGRQSAVELAQQFGLSPSSVSAYAVGATSTSSYGDRPNRTHINGVKERISKKARGKLLLALSKLTSDKLDGVNGKDLSGIAKDMSAIVKNMEPEKDNNAGNGDANKPAFVVYSPTFRDERHYEVVVVKE